MYIIIKIPATIGSYKNLLYAIRIEINWLTVEYVRSGICVVCEKKVEIVITRNLRAKFCP